MEPSPHTLNQVTKKNSVATVLRSARLLISRNWRIKGLALLIAFLFWHTIRREISTVKKPTFSDQHSLKGAADL
jgi:hypothetical protein